MTEAQWLACNDPGPMLELLRGKASDRKLRLFAVACCKRVWPFLIDTRSREAVEVAEGFSDGLASEKELVYAARSAAQVPSDPAYAVAPPYSTVTAIEHARVAALVVAAHPINEAIATTAATAGHTSIAASLLRWDEGRGYWLDELRSRLTLEQGAQARLLHDIFGPLPFRPVTIEPSWRTPHVKGSAQAAHDERQLPVGTLDPHRLAVLADALEEAGCADADMLGRLRSPGPHARGCWVVDAVLAMQ